MPEMNPSENLVASSKIFSGPQNSNDDSEFVEVDPTGQYGRYNEVLGKGSFKVVYKGFDEVNGIEVAWNQVKVKDVVQRTEDLGRLYSEVNILKALKHKNIIKLYSSWVDSKNDNINFITEIFTSGTLRQYRKKHKHVEMKAIKSWARQILRGLLYLHSHDPPIIHRDLKCDNIFVNGNQGEVKIGDLGLATILRQANAAHSVIGTPEFMAPELYEEEYNELVDIYSFGMCVLEMVTSEYPYSECANAAQIYKKVTSGKKPAALEKVKDLEVRSFVNKCLAPASERLPARELLMDSFLHRDLDSETVELQTRSLQSRINEMNDHGKYLKEHIKAISCDEGIDFNKMLASTSEVIDKNVSVPKAVCVSGDTMSCDKGHQKQQIQSTSEDMSRKPSSSSSGDEHTANSRDFVIKGKRREDDTIHLRLRIRTPEGNFRNIHFPFDVEADTAICVASEMVAELDLSDQDVTAIAEMIDIEIISLVPDWKPGAAFDESLVVDSEDPSGQAFDGDCNSSSAVKVAASEEPFLDPLPICSTPCSSTLKVEPLEVATPCIELPTIFGRFEEVPYTTSGSDYSCGSDSSSFSDSCDLHGGGDHEDLESMQSYPVTPKSFCSGVGDGLQVDSPYALSCTFHLQPPSSSDMATEVAFLPFYQQDARHRESVDPSSSGKFLDNATNINMDKEGMFEVCDKDLTLLDIDHAKAERENSDKQGDFNIENIANTDTFKSLEPMVGSSIPTIDSCSLLQVGADTEKLGPSMHWRHDFLPYIKDGEVNRPNLHLESDLPRLAASESGESRKMENTETTEIEQRRKEQLQKSIAELEVLTLQGLHSSKPSYLASFSKRFTGGSLQASKAVPTLSQLRQQSHIGEKKV